MNPGTDPNSHRKHMETNILRGNNGLGDNLVLLYPGQTGEWYRYTNIKGTGFKSQGRPILQPRSEPHVYLTSAWEVICLVVWVKLQRIWGICCIMWGGVSGISSTSIKTGSWSLCFYKGECGKIFESLCFIVKYTCFSPKQLSKICIF